MEVVLVHIKDWEKEKTSSIVSIVVTTAEELGIVIVGIEVTKVGVHRGKDLYGAEIWVTDAENKVEVDKDVEADRQLIEMVVITSVDMRNSEVLIDVFIEVY